MKLESLTTNDGSRHFLSIPENLSFNKIRKQVSKLDGAIETEYLTDGALEVWIDFEFRNHKFTINNQLGEYWFFAKNPKCPETILLQIAKHFTK